MRDLKIVLHSGMEILSELTKDLDEEIDYCNRAIRFLEPRTDNEPDKYPEQEIGQYYTRREVAQQQRTERLKFIFGT